jgi:DNA repair protein RadD
MKIKLRDYQQDAVNGFWRFIKKTKGNPVLVLPTAAGKSVIMAKIIQDTLSINYRVLVLCRQKELLVQNQNALRGIDGDINSGVFCAGLGKKQTEQDVIFASIQSVAERAFDLGRRDLVIIDEAHQLPRNEQTQYGTFLRDMKTASPNMRVLGLTATPYRLDCGSIVGEGQPFDGVAYEVPVKKMLDDNYVTPLKSVSVSTVDTSNVQKSGWDFNLSQLGSCFEEVAEANASEIVSVANTAGRQSCLVFTSSVKHAELVTEEIQKLTGQRVGLITGDTFSLEREKIISDFKGRRLRWLVNCSVLTTGFDAPCTDLLAVCRATLSPALFAQIAGRGLRLYPGKDDCLFLDFGGNVQRHGPIDDPFFGMREIKRQANGEPVTKECPNCKMEVPAGVRYCECGFQFPPPEIKVSMSADSIAQIMKAGVAPKWYDVSDVKYFVHTPKDENKTASLRVEYTCTPELEEGEELGNLQTRRFSEWICLIHEGFAGKKARDWWRKRSYNDQPETLWEAAELAAQGALCCPSRIRVKPDGKYHRITDYQLTEKPPRVELFDEEAPF